MRLDAAGKILDAIKINDREPELGIALRKLRGGLGQLGLVRGGVDFEEDFPGLHILAVGEKNLDDFARDLRLDGDHFKCRALADLIQIDGHIARQHVSGGDERGGWADRRRMGDGLTSLATGCQGQGTGRGDDAAKTPEGDKTLLKVAR